MRELDSPWIRARFSGLDAELAEALGADAYALSLYKVYGPHLGVLYVKPDLLGKLDNQNHAFLRGKGMKTLMPGFTSHELAASVPGVVEYLRSIDEHHGGEGTLEGAFEQNRELEARVGELEAR